MAFLFISGRIMSRSELILWICHMRSLFEDRVVILLISSGWNMRGFDGGSWGYCIEWFEDLVLIAVEDRYVKSTLWFRHSWWYCNCDECYILVRARWEREKDEDKWWYDSFWDCPCCVTSRTFAMTGALAWQVTIVIKYLFSWCFGGDGTGF